MKYRTLPGTKLDVSEVCLGTMTWGEQNSEAEAHAQLDYAVGAGHQLHRHRGDVPGAAERDDPGPHRNLSRHAGSRGRPRDNLVIATKVAGPGRRDWIRGGRTDLTRDVIAEAVDTSLARLQIDYIDLYQIHWPQRNVPMFGATEFDPSKEKDGPVDSRAGRGHGRDDQGGQDPPLRLVERNRVGRVRVPARRPRARRARAR